MRIIWSSFFSTMQNKRRCLVFVALLAWVGLSLTILQWVHFEMRKELLKTGVRLAQALNEEAIQALPFTAEDRLDPRFAEITRELRHLSTAVQLGWSPARNYVGIYTMKQRGGALVFGPESITEEDPRASPPGTVYENPPDALEKVFATGRAVVVGPFRDEYGTFISVFLPLQHSGQPVGPGVVLGVDILFQDWLGALFWNSVLPLGLLTAFLLALFSAVFTLVEHSSIMSRGISPCVLIILMALLVGGWLFIFFRGIEPSDVVEDVQPEEQLFAGLVPPPVAPPPPDVLEHSLGLPGSGPDVSQEVVRLHGSSSILPVVRAAAGMMGTRSIELRWRGGSAEAGVQALRDGQADIAMLARAPTAEELEEFAAVTLGWDALVVIVNRLNPVTNLDRQELRQIFSGATTAWPEPLPAGDSSILLVGRREGRASTELFGSFLLPEDIAGEFPWAPTPWMAGANSEVLLWVAGLPNAIGYVSWADARRFKAVGLPVRVVEIEGVSPTEENIRNGSYPLLRPLTLLYRREETSAAAEVATWFESPPGRKLLQEFFIWPKEAPPKGENP
jgi:phosphate transport system substrate-binding protein